MTTSTSDVKRVGVLLADLAAGGWIARGEGTCLSVDATLPEVIA